MSRTMAKPLASTNGKADVRRRVLERDGQLRFCVQLPEPARELLAELLALESDKSGSHARDENVSPWLDLVARSMPVDRFVAGVEALVAAKILVPVPEAGCMKLEYALIEAVTESRLRGKMLKRGGYTRSSKELAKTG